MDKLLCVFIFLFLLLFILIMHFKFWYETILGVTDHVRKNNKNLIFIRYKLDANKNTSKLFIHNLILFLCVVKKKN